MGDVTKIEWADRTFNPWIGCQKVGPGCDSCYAEAMDHRFGGGHWGPGAPRKRTSASNWKKPLAWDRAQAALVAKHEAEYDGLNPNPPAPCFVFCASLADVFDNAVPAEWRSDLFDLIAKTPNLTWLLLTKRPGNITRLFRGTIGDDEPSILYLEKHWPRNAAIGCTVVNQEEADRDVPKLLQAKKALKPAFAFLSMEPLLASVDLRNIDTMVFRGAECLDALTGEVSGFFGDGAYSLKSAIDWVIVGGESGPKARPMPLDAARAIRDQCDGTDAVFNFKQVGGRGSDKGGHELDGRTYFGRPSI